VALKTGLLRCARNDIIGSAWSTLNAVDIRAEIDELTDTQIDTALERGQIARGQEPCAAAARYDRVADRIVIDLTNGCTFSFPGHLAQGLQAATADELAAVEILGAGTG
jgi:hypothetical protein